MSTERFQLDQEIAAGITNDSLAAAGHLVAPRDGLQVVEHHVDPAIKNAQPLPDGTFLLSMADPAQRAQLATLPIGTVIDHIAAFPPTVDTPLKKQLVAQALSTVCMVVGSHLDETKTLVVDVITASRFDKNGKRTPWNKKDEVMDVRADALGVLNTYFAPSQGAETTQMLGTLFQASPHQAENNTILSSIGHVSHEDPLGAFGENLLPRVAGVTFARGHIALTNRQDNQTAGYVRCAADSQTGEISGLTYPTSSNERVFQVAFATTAHIVSLQNPSGFGAGTAPEQVFDAMQSTTQALPELVQNGASLGHATQLFRRTMGNRSL